MTDKNTYSIVTTPTGTPVEKAYIIQARLSNGQVSELTWHGHRQFPSKVTLGGEEFHSPCIVHVS